jgi:hypothetical protein
VLDVSFCFLIICCFNINFMKNKNSITAVTTLLTYLLYSLCTVSAAIILHIYLNHRDSVFSMLSNAGILPSESEREPWNDLSRPIYERLHLKRQAQNNGEFSDTLLEQLSSQRDSVTENNETYQTQVRRSSIKNFFSGMEIEELQSATPTRLPTIR